MGDSLQLTPQSLHEGKVFDSQFQSLVYDTIELKARTDCMQCGIRNQGPPLSKNNVRVRRYRDTLVDLSWGKICPHVLHELLEKNLMEVAWLVNRQPHIAIYIIFILAKEKTEKYLQEGASFHCQVLPEHTCPTYFFWSMDALDLNSYPHNSCTQYCSQQKWTDMLWRYQAYLCRVMTHDYNSESKLNDLWLFCVMHFTA